jgi:hypothetical protein
MIINHASKLSTGPRVVVSFKFTADTNDDDDDDDDDE